MNRHFFTLFFPVSQTAVFCNTGAAQKKTFYFIQYRTLLGKGGKSGALGENNVTKRELCNENR